MVPKPAPTAATNALALYAAARRHADQHALDDALLGLDQALAQDPLLAPAHYLHGLILQERGHAAAALEALRRCVYADPQFVLGHYALGSLLARQGEAERARKALANVKRLLAGRARDELIPEGDSLTVGRLLEMAALHQDL
jgi:chemotaxis protein methyltransferase CheR